MLAAMWFVLAETIVRFEEGLMIDTCFVQPLLAWLVSGQRAFVDYFNRLQKSD